ncbi:MAG: Uma2 family endonuclease [Myxococcales bacterium]|nr:Uma2 family endonuclease [Myxococcales bacterium]
MDAAHQELATEDEYLARERGSEDKHEYVNGRIVAMAGASTRHTLIAGNIQGALRGLLRGKPCLALGSDQRVHIAETRLYTYPDVTVVCGPAKYHSRDPLSLTNPLLLVEVLSDSTELYDRGAKFAHYRRLPSLQEILLVAQAERRVELYRRIEHPEWLFTERVGEGAVTLSSLGVDLSLAEIYDKVELLDSAQ